MKYKIRHETPTQNIKIKTCMRTSRAYKSWYFTLPASLKLANAKRTIAMAARNFMVLSEIEKSKRHTEHAFEFKCIRAAVTSIIFTCVI